ncbi:MAG: hypothetical protein MZU91_07385 [Desulfosudis oleivorans]|nr:hypothetical protein [Desulfosudis oleivorans]
MISRHVFHHIPRPRRPATVADLSRTWMKPASRIVIWEHNPFNPFTRLLVKMCPFDGDARLLDAERDPKRCSRRARLPQSFEHAYVNVVPAALAAARAVSPPWSQARRASRRALSTGRCLNAMNSLRTAWKAYRGEPGCRRGCMSRCAP